MGRAETLIIVLKVQGIPYRGGFAAAGRFFHLEPVAKFVRGQLVGGFV